MFSFLFMIACQSEVVDKTNTEATAQKKEVSQASPKEKKPSFLSSMTSVPWSHWDGLNPVDRGKEDMT